MAGPRELWNNFFLVEETLGARQDVIVRFFQANGRLDGPGITRAKENHADLLKRQAIRSVCVIGIFAGSIILVIEAVINATSR